MENIFEKGKNDEWKIDAFIKMFSEVDYKELERQLKGNNADKYLIDKALVPFDARKNICKKYGKLYKYCSFGEYDLLNLTNSIFYMNNPKNFNDPYDCYYNLLISSDFEQKEKKEVDEIKQGLLEIGWSEKKVSEFMDFTKYKIVINQMNSMRKDIKICCFSENSKSVLLWSHYADKHRGFCLEYDFSGYTDFQYNLKPVLYADFNSIKKVSGFKTVDYFEMLALLKFKEWSYEKEWRLINKDSKEKMISPKPNKIIMGINIAMKNKQELYEYTTKNEIELRQMKLDFDDFRLYDIEYDSSQLEFDNFHNNYSFGQE